MDTAHRISITVCGDGGCGKSSITLRLVRSQWTHEYDPTIEDSYSVTRTIDGVTYSLSLTDTAGQEEYRGLWSASNLGADAFLFVYDITQAGSLQALEYFNEMIEIERETRMEQDRVLPVCIVAGNKCDLQGMRQISARDGLEWAKSRGYGFMETSAREMVNIEETFALLVKRVRDMRIDYGNGVKPAVPTATSRTLPLEPLPMTNEKAVPPGPGSYSQNRSPDRPKKQSFWSKLKCW
ncbi:hypothetical protein LTR56_016755 [Elasticomyces elasticus]|nr:hypothetical protein LTR56_016755 [Elasticomyces elasticus]KAK3662722.1 hypothetical protein LTR22_006573 [Elasticomyces elasticus]KAK4923378.1 hypothetical protein LTR49_009448 [Elasticomyces elasticus]KAK5753283.1 hypothetical protein LTS12_016619 [Elasticomyces elasticus]